MTRRWRIAPRCESFTGMEPALCVKASAEFLKSHPLVEHAQFETEENGGKAITVVSLKD